MAPSGGAKRELGRADAGYAALARLKMARAERAALGEAVPVAALEEELEVVGAALQACPVGSEDLAVLAEFWEEADEALVATLVARAPEEALDARLQSPNEIVELPGADAEAAEAWRELVAGGGAPDPWPIDEDIEAFVPSAPAAMAQAKALATPCRAQPSQRPPLLEPTAPAGTSSAPVAAAPADRGNAPTPAGEPAPRVSSFRTASQMCPVPKAQAPNNGGNSGGSSLNFNDVSKSITGKKPAPGASPQPPEKKDGQKAEGGREWSEAWLRIAEPDQLERIVPALEATIHRDSGRDKITRSDIAGLGFVKTQIEEVLILPQMHPELFSSALTRPARGLLLFGPPGTGKTLLARWIAAECGATFFNVNASSVLSKWIGEAEKTVKALFQLAADRQPSVIFIDEIDSMLSQRRDGDNESSRRVKNEFLTSLEGAETAAEEKILLVGATNMPWELDPAALRRLPKRLYVPLPGRAARRSLLQTQLAKHNAGQGLKGALSASDIDRIAERTDGFSGSDLQSLLREAAMGPVREASASVSQSLRKRAAAGGGGAGSAPSALVLRDISTDDFECAMRRVKPSYNQDQGSKHREFNEEHGTCRGEDAMRDTESDTEDLPLVPATMAGAPATAASATTAFA